MELPKPPDDPDMMNIIDKLANFVARNGPEFELMTKQKQRDNPKFSFLFGGENFNYYQYKVTTEQAMFPPPAVLKKQLLMEQQQQQQQQQQMLAQQQQAIVQQEQEKVAVLLQQQISTLQQQITTLQTQMADQITQSESNLAAQYQSMMRQQQVQIEEAILSLRQEKLKKQAEACEVDLAVLDETVQPIIDSCTKDAIMHGKTWIMARTPTDEHCDLMSNYFLDRLTSKEASFSLRLHLIYLMYDIIHHCVRRNVEGLKESLEKVVVPIFCTARMGADDGAQTEKLDKLLKLWENHGYLNKDTLEKLHDPAQAISAYQASLITDNADVVTQISSNIQTQYAALQKQHQEFCNHLNLQLTTAQQQLALLMTQEHQVASKPVGSTGVTDGPPPVSQVVSLPLTSVGAPVQTTSPSDSSVGGDPVIGPITTAGVAPPGVISIPPAFTQPPPTFDPMVPPPGLPPPGMPPPQPQQFEYGHGIGAVSAMPPSGDFALPDLSKPPPGFPPTSTPGIPPPSLVPPPLLPTDMDLTPSVPYYDLPAGLMAPLVKLDEVDYKPLDPKDIRLPPPMAPSERLLAAVDAFYTPPSRERPRDSEGWEKLGLYEFFKAKHRAKKNREEGRRRYSRSRSRSRSPSRSRSRSRSRSATPPRRRRFDSEAEERHRNRSRSRSRSQTPPSRRRSRTRSKSRSKSRSSSRSRSRSPAFFRRSRSPTPESRTQRRVSKERSATPPSFNPGLGMAPMVTPTEQRLGETNKGHQLLMKMGWSGKGLGASEQGIVDPIEAAEVRDKVDMRKGIGIDLKDPFEQFRKSKAQGFIQRMRARDEGPADPPERKKPKKEREPST